MTDLNKNISKGFIRRTDKQNPGAIRKEDSVLSTNIFSQGNSNKPSFNFSNIPVQSKSVFLQTKLSSNVPGDKYEREADSIANTVSSSTNAIPGNGKIPGRNISPVSDTGVSNTKEVTPEIRQNIESTSGKGNQLDDKAISTMSGKFDTDFSRVRIHTDDEAANMNKQLKANAFTVGHDIYFDSGKYKPGIKEGDQLIAHELTHVVQQNKGNHEVQKEDKDAEQAAAVEATKKATAITKIKSYGIISVDDSDATFTSAELDLVDKAMSGLPPGDKASINGAKIVRVSSLGPTTGGQYGNDQGFSGTTVTDEQKIELSDRAFGSLPSDESIRLITHEVGHAIAGMKRRTAKREEILAGAKSNKLSDEANVAVDAFNLANDESNTAIESNNSAIETLNDAMKSKDQDAIKEAKADLAAKKAIMVKLQAERTVKESVFNAKKAAVDAQNIVLATKEAATKAKNANIDDFKSDASSKLTSMQNAFTSSQKAIPQDDTESSDFRLALSAAEDAIKTFYDENVKVEVDEATATAAKSVVDAAIQDRNTKRAALDAVNATNAVTPVTASVESAQDNCYTASLKVVFNRKMSLAVRKFYDLVIKNSISPALTPYAAENWPVKPEEFYAEAYSYFVTKPADLEAHSKILYDWFKAGSYK